MKHRHCKKRQNQRLSVQAVKQEFVSLHFKSELKVEPGGTIQELGSERWVTVPVGLTDDEIRQRCFAPGAEVVRGELEIDQ